MSGLGESLGINILGEVVVTCVVLGYNIIQNARLYAHEGESFHLRLRLQIGIWQAINQKLSDPEIRRRMRPTDIATYSDVMKQLHSLLRRYVKRKCQPGPEKNELLKTTSASALFESLEERDILRTLSERERIESRKFWLRLKDEAAWTVWRKGKNERLVSEIEFWGAQLDRYSSWTIPGMFSHASMADIATHVIDDTGSLNATNLKGQLMMARAGSCTGTVEPGAVKQESYLLDVQRIKFLGRGYVRPSSERLDVRVTDTQAEYETYTDLGGLERRQWAHFSEDTGNASSVIIEFKARPGPEDARFLMGRDVIANEIDTLISALRIAAQTKETFRVLYCEGWYEAFDHFGLVYRLPSKKSRFGQRCESLGNILLKREYCELLKSDLENRLRLGKALAWTLFDLHSVDWVHKSFHTDNILLFGEEISPDSVNFDWSCPYVVGFDGSRSNSGISGKQTSRELSVSRLYTHPDRQLKEYERYKKTHDIYALGVVLLEIGLLSSFWGDRQETENLNNMAPQQIKEKLVQKARTLHVILGKGFRDVVLTCLTEQFVHKTDDYQLLKEFRCKICEKLDQIKIS